MRIYHCRTQGEYHALMHRLEAEGYRWSPMEKATDLNKWGVYGEHTCVRTLSGFLFVDSREYYERAFPFVEIEEVRGENNGRSN